MKSANIMHLYAFAAILLAGATTASPADCNIRSAVLPHTPTMNAAAPQVVYPNLDSAPSHINDGLELCQAPGLMPVVAPPAEVVEPAVPAAAPAAPVVPPAAFPAPSPGSAAPGEAIPPANQAVPPVLPSAVSVPLIPATTTMPLQALVTGDDFITVQWVETQIGTLRTWVPKTQIFHFEAVSQAPLPGVGSVGMGTLTGQTGQTQTIEMVVGAAPTPKINSKKVIGAAVAAGLAGLVV